MIYDLIIVGGGTSAMSAAIYAARKKINALVLAKETGGQTAKASEVENYPGIKKIMGVELALNFADHARSAGAKMQEGEIVENIQKNTDIFDIKTQKGTYQSKSVIIASGKVPRSLDVSGEKEFLGKGVAYCATCDAPLFHNKTVVVVGGGNSALEAAFELVKYDNKVIIAVRKGECRADAVEIEKAEKDKNITISYNTQVKKIEGDKFVGKVTLLNNSFKKEETIDAQGVFVEIGWAVATDFISKDLKTNQYGEIITDHNTGTTSIEGLFAAGDVTDVKYKQAVIAAGAGAIAALSANEFLHKK